MFMLTPKSYDNDTFTNTYAPLLKSQLDLCKFENTSCPTLIIYGMCIKQSEHSTEIRCLTYGKTKITCHNGLWNKNAYQIYEDCTISLFLLRSILTKLINKLLVPVLLIALSTCIFRLHEFSEVYFSFQWQMIAKIIYIKIFTLLTNFAMSFLNSGEIISASCIWIAIVNMLDFYIPCSMLFSTYLYVYGLVFCNSTPIRNIEDSASSIGIYLPVIFMVIQFGFDVRYEQARMLSCTGEPLISKQHLIQVFVKFVLLSSMFIMRIIFHSYFKEMNLGNLTHTIRVEYDILGCRKQVSSRDMNRYINILDLSLIVLFFTFILKIVICLTPFIMHHFKAYYILSSIAVNLIDIAYILFIMKLVWFNPSLTKLITSLKRWHWMVNEKAAETENEQFFRALKLADEDETQSTGSIGLAEYRTDDSQAENDEKLSK